MAMARPNMSMVAEEIRKAPPRRQRLREEGVVVTPAERAKEKNEAVFWAFIEAQGKCEAAWAKIDKLAAATEPHDKEFEESDEERDLDGAEGHAAFLEWELAIESGATDQAFDEWLCEGEHGQEDVE